MTRYERTDQGQQAIIPGAEHKPPRPDTGPTKAKAPQRGLDGAPLFDPSARPQPQLFD